MEYAPEVLRQVHRAHCLQKDPVLVKWICAGYAPGIQNLASGLTALWVPWSSEALASTKKLRNMLQRLSARYTELTAFEKTLTLTNGYAPSETLTPDKHPGINIECKMAAESF